MAITYLGGGIVEGSSVGVRTPTYSTTFGSTSGWTSNDTHVFIDTANNMLEFELDDDNTNEFISYDMGAGNISNTEWVLRCEITFNTWNGQTNDNNNLICIGCYDNASPSGINPSGDYLAWGWYMRGTSSTDGHDTKMRSSNNGTVTENESANNPFSSSTATATPFYLELKRVSADSLEFRCFSDSSYSTQVGSTQTRSTSSAVTALRHITIQLFCQGTIAGGGYTGYIQNLKFYNATTASTQDEKTTLNSSTSSSYGTVSFAGGISGNPDTRNLQIPTNPLQAVTVGSGGASTTAFTISFWMKSNNGIDSNDAFMGTMDGASSNGDHFQIRISDGDGLEIMDGSTYAKWGSDYTRASINNNVWHHIALTRPASSSVVTAYLDGIDKGDETYTGRFTSNTSNTTWLAINGRGDNTGVAGVMSIQDLGFWTRELSGADIAVLATGKPINKATLATTYTTGLTSYYDFDGDYAQSGGSNGTNTGSAGAGVSRATSGGKFDTYSLYTSNIPEGTRWHETDTRKTFRMKDGNWVEKGTA